MLKLPRDVELDPRRAEIERVLSRDVRPLWAGATFTAVEVPFTPSLERALIDVLRGRQLARGLETIDQVLDRERAGLQSAQQKGGSGAPNRISRLLVLANDGSERFYRQVEATVKRNADRVLALRVEADSTRFAERLFGADKLVRVVLVSDRDAVVRVLGALAMG